MNNKNKLNRVPSVCRVAVSMWNTEDLREQSAMGTEALVWGEGDSGPAISDSEIKAQLDIGNPGIPPGIYADDPVNGELCNHAECSRLEHIERIVWIINNFDKKKAVISCVSFSGTLSVENGHHTLAAALYLDEETVPVQIGFGHAAEIEGMDGFSSWVKPPIHGGVFGKDVISTEDEFWQVGNAEPGNKIWVNNSEGCCIAQYKNFPGTGGLININGKGEMGPHIDRQYFIDLCAKEISPALKYIDYEIAPSLSNTKESSFGY